MTMNMFRRAASGFPKLHGKAAECRHLGKPLLKAWAVHMDQNSDAHRYIKLALQLSVKFEDILDANLDPDCFVLPPKSQRDLLNTTVGFNQAVTALGHHFHTGLNESLFNFTVKNHYLLHVAMLAKYGNPRKLWCYAGEDFMHKAKELIAHSVSGTPHYLVPTKVAKKYIAGLGFTIDQKMAV